MIYAVDFDGTCVLHEYPRIGPDVPGAVEALKRIVARGDPIILWTMRSGPALDIAVGWFRGHGIPLYGINVNPEQHHWTTSPKAYAHRYIDDAALGTPLIHGDHRPYVNWPRIEEIILETP